MSASLLQRLIQLILPTRCVLCQQLGPDVVCDKCRAGLEHVGAQHCLRCGRRKATDYASPDCSECYGRNLGLTKARSLLIYNASGRALLAEFKFKGSIGAGLTLIDGLCSWAATSWTSVFDEPAAGFDVVIPVPLHHKRLRSRSFNQAEVIARQVARKTGLACQPELLRRIRETPSQVGLSANQRLLNVRGAFAVPDKLRSQLEGRRVLLVDDLMTTGATLGACGRALRRGGSGPVYGLTLFSTHHACEPPDGL